MEQMRMTGVAVLCLAMAFGSTAALAAGDGPDRATGPSSGRSTAAPPRAPVKQPDLTTCPRGRVWDPGRRTCVARSSGLPDAMLTEYAYALAKAKRYQEAIEVLDALADQNTPTALNYRGYATRHLGRTEEGIDYYLRSVALDPNYVQVREYLGEAYVLQGRLDLAKEQLATIQALCNGPCDEAEDLEEMIATGKAEE